MPGFSASWEEDPTRIVRRRCVVRVTAPARYVSLLPGDSLTVHGEGNDVDRAARPNPVDVVRLRVAEEPLVRRKAGALIRFPVG
jgi:hypothetical protein